MSKLADSIRRGLREAVAYADGKADESIYRVHVPKKIDVKAIRARLKMTQEEFAARFGFSINTAASLGTGCAPAGGADARLSFGHRPDPEGGAESTPISVVGVGACGRQEYQPHPYRITISP